MNPSNSEHNRHLEMQWQKEAEQRERMQSKERDDAAIDQYRFLERVLRQDNTPTIPQGFAARVLQLIHDFDENAAFEKWVLRIMICAALIGAIWFALPQWIMALGKISASMELPWHMLLATAIALVFAAAIDYLSRHYLFTAQAGR